MKTFIDHHRERFGVEPLCKVLQIAPSAYRRHAARQRQPELRSARDKRDETLSHDIRQVWEENLQVYGADKVWRALKRQGVAVARCTVERLMKRLGLHGVRRGKTVRTTVADEARPCPLDRVNRQFLAQRPNAAVGVGFHLCLDLAGVGVRGVRSRRVRAPDRGLAGLVVGPHGLRARCAGTGAVRPPAWS